MTINEQKDYHIKTIRWFKNTYESIYRAGGNPSVILAHLSPETLLTFINNNLQIRYEKP